MYRSLFSKYLSAFLLIIVVAFSILVAVIGSMMSDYTNEVNGEVLSRVAERSKEYFEIEYYESGKSNFNQYVYYESNIIRRMMSTMSVFSDNSFIFVTDNEGIVLFSNCDDIEIEDTVNIEKISEIKENGSIRYRSNNLDGLLPSECLICTSAINDNSENFVGAVFVCMNSSVLDSFENTMIKTLIMECLWVLLAALIAVYFISERITRPLKEMSVAAKSFASGRFDVRVPVIGHNEVADLAQAFNNMAGSLAKLEDMRRTFLANVSHDLRTPMTTIAGFIDGILDGAIPPEKHEYYLGIIASEVRRLSRLVTTLLDITRIQAGERKFNMEPFDICEMARLILISFEQRIGDKKLNVSLTATVKKCLCLQTETLYIR